ncbi:MAG: mono/diheme cytochrome c family protein [Planctomycetota bacterium]|jgi:mono/diheme cytochrome c family protein
MSHKFPSVDIVWFASLCVMRRPTLHLAAALLLSAAGTAQQPTDAITTLRDVHVLLQRNCIECHGADKQKGETRFDTLAKLAPADRAELLGRALEMVQLGEMPPEDEPQPSHEERKQLSAWLTAQLDAADGPARRDKLRYPHYGNLVDHEQLFSGAVHAKAYTPSRRWLVSPQIFHERVMDVFQLTGRDRQNKQHSSFVGVTNPFILTDHSGVRYYDIDALDGGDLLVMLGNAKWIADRQILIARLVGGDKQVAFPNPKDRWKPRSLPKSYAAFTTILRKTDAPTLAEMTAAVQEQFDCVLRQPANDAQQNKYVELMRSSIALAGNAAGLRQMLVAVLLESDFVYRREFGNGPVDQHGRNQLAPREAAYAISYALGDRRPDAKLTQAAVMGKLATGKDYAREVRRLLADPNYYRGQIDPSLNGKHFRSNVTSHPKIIRFFREFFGYPTATKIFKDPPRSGGIYRNPGRGTTATPGRLILETDRMVTRFVENDQDVFRLLLTSNEFYVYHDKDNAKGQQIIAEWQQAYERLKHSNWRTEPKQVLAEHLEFLKGIKSMRVKDASRPGELINYMHFFDDYFGQGIKPFTTHPWAHGYTLHHAPLYNLPPTPGIGRYGSWKSSKYLGDKIAKKTFWDYPTKQPFRIKQRMGILTHPSWLIAHSTNFFPDAIRRGRWIREKLLAGRVPDVPITVDAQVPDDPHKTFRLRVEEVTAPNECWKCHKHMNPLGLPFESFDDFGRFRTEEALEHPDNLIKPGNGKTTFDVYPTAPVVTTGGLTGTGDPQLDGNVVDAFDLIGRLARSGRVRQSIIRHAFRFYLGRNELLSDAQTLLNADRAYVDNGGSFRAVIVSLLSSDSFVYRKAPKDKS